MTRNQALKVLADHFLTSNEQTASFNGAMVASGSSFDEMIGVRETYNRSEIYQWLGY